MIATEVQAPLLTLCRFIGGPFDGKVVGVAHEPGIYICLWTQKNGLEMHPARYRFIKKQRWLDDDVEREVHNYGYLADQSE